MIFTKAIRSKALRDSAQGETCTLNIAGVCNYDIDTTVLAHLPSESHGMGLKADDTCSCYACSSCHDAIDRRANSIPDAEREFYMRRGMARTTRRFIVKGLYVVKGMSHE